MNNRKELIEIYKQLLKNLVSNTDFEKSLFGSDICYCSSPYCKTCRGSYFPTISKTIGYLEVTRSYGGYSVHDREHRLKVEYAPDQGVFWIMDTD